MTLDRTLAVGKNNPIIPKKKRRAQGIYYGLISVIVFWVNPGIASCNSDSKVCIGKVYSLPGEIPHEIA